jgi:hypothetical protein
VIQIKRSVKRTVRAIPGDAAAGVKPRRLIITRTKTSTRQTVR